MSYFGKRYTPVPAFDPSSIVPINSTAVLSSVSSVDKTYFLNSPATYNVTLPQLSTIPLGSTLTFVHNHSSGYVTLVAYSGDSILFLGASVTFIQVIPGDVTTLEFTGTSWNIILNNRGYTQPQGTSDTSFATTAFVMNESNRHNNYIINGAFSIWQRATSLSSGTGIRFAADRFFNDSAGSTYSVSQQTFTPGQTAVPGEPTFYHRTVVSSVAGGSNYSNFVQRIEGIRNLAGRIITLSFWAKADSAKNMAVDFSQNFGTTGSPSPQVNFGSATIALTTTFKQYTVTVQVPSISGKTTGLSLNDYLQATFWFDAGSNFNSRTNNLVQQSGTFDIALVKLEEGISASPFEYRNLSQEFELCTRYYEKNSRLVKFWGVATAASQSLGIPFTYIFPKRSIALVVTSGITYVNCGSLTIDQFNLDGFAFYVNSTASGSVTVSFNYTADAEL